LRLGVAVLITSLHDPLQLAATISASTSSATVGWTSNRHGNFRPFSAFGVEKATFISYFTDGLEPHEGSLVGPPDVTFHGRFRDVEGCPFNPNPCSAPTRRSGSAEAHQRHCAAPYG